MTNTYKWSVISLTVVPSLDGFTQVVTAADWRLDATDTESPPNTSFTSGVAQFSAPSAPYTVFSTLAQDQVIAWVQTALGSSGAAAAQAQCDAAISSEENLNAPVILPPPWGL